MKALTLEWLSDTSDCDTAGCSGGWAQGARVTLDGELLVELLPEASCFGSENHWEDDEVYEIILEKLGYKLERA